MHPHAHDLTTGRSPNRGARYGILQSAHSLPQIEQLGLHFAQLLGDLGLEPLLQLQDLQFGLTYLQLGAGYI